MRTYDLISLSRLTIVYFLSIDKEAEVMPILLIHFLYVIVFIKFRHIHYTVTASFFKTKTPRCINMAMFDSNVKGILKVQFLGERIIRAISSPFCSLPVFIVKRKLNKIVSAHEEITERKFARKDSPRYKLKLDVSCNRVRLSAVNGKYN